MIHLFIDCSTLIHLHSISGTNPFLLELLNQIDNGKIYLLSHTLSIEEWTKHKGKVKIRGERKLLGGPKDDILGSNEMSLSYSMINIEHIDNQIELIDEILSKAHLLETHELITNEFAKRYRNRLAPFHNKLQSQNDWEIIGTICNYCELNGVKNLYFLSANYKDFADPTEINKTIHPHLQERFQKVKIHFFRHYSDFFREFGVNEIFVPELLTSQIIQNNKYNYKNTLKYNDLDSLYYIYNNLYAEINFIPHHILAKFYPFSDDSSKAMPGLFAFQYVRERLFLFFDNVKILQGGEIAFDKELLITGGEDYINKVKYVLRHLSMNLVFSLSGEKSRKVKHIHFYTPRECNCFHCSFYRLKFYEMCNGANFNELELKGKLQFAYIHYQYGNYQTAAKLYKEIWLQAHKERKYITYFIAKYNMKMVGYFLSLSYYLEDRDLNLFDECQKIDPLEELVKLKSISDYNLLSFIAQEDFFTTAFQKISEKRNDILKHYYSQLDGGWSSNQNVGSLVYEFAKLDTFLNSNYIICDNFSNFEKLFDIVTEGLFASHAISDGQDKFYGFDDYWINKFIFYGNSSKIKTYFNRFDLKRIKYSESGKENDTLVDLLDNFFCRYETSGTNSPFFVNNDYRPFREKVNKWFNNIVTLISILDISNEVTKKFVNLLLHFLKRDKLLYFSSYSSVSYFISRKGKQLETQQLQQILLYFLFSDEHISEDIIEKLLDCFDVEELTFFEQPHIERFLFLCNKESLKIPMQFLPLLHNKLPITKRILIKRFIEKELETNFNFELYYLSVIYDVFPFEFKKISEFLEQMNFEEFQGNMYFKFGSPLYQNDYLDKILNICFKFNQHTDIPEFEKAKNAHPYYEWLIDMEAFDYSKFNPEWVLNYPTIYYHKRMAKSDSLIAALVCYLEENNHLGIEHVLLKITYFVKKDY